MSAGAADRAPLRSSALPAVASVLPTSSEEPSSPLGPVVVIGAGVTGLAAAYALLRAGVDVLVLDGAPRVGGVIDSVALGPVRVEAGPQSLRAASAPIAGLLDAVGLRDHVVPAHPDADRRYLWFDGRLRRVPYALLDPRFMPATAALRVLGELFVPACPDPRETVGAFARRRIGPVATERVLDAVVAGVFGGDIDALEVGAAFPKMLALERDHGGLIRGAFTRRNEPAPPDWAPRRPFSFGGGMAALPRAIAAALGDERVRTGVAARSIRRRGSGWVVETDVGAFEGARVVVAAPGAAAAALHPALGPVAQVPPARIVSVHLVWPEGAVDPRRGFGWLSPKVAGLGALGAIWVSSAFPGACAGHRVVRVMLGGRRDPQRASEDDQALVARACWVVREVEGVDVAPSYVAVHRGAIPQYEADHAGRIAGAEAALPGVRLLGWGFGGIGVAQCLEAGLSVT